MDSKIQKVLLDKQVVEKIKKKLPVLFSIAELECSRAGKVGMEVGSTREKILVAMLIHFLGSENVETELPITEPEVDVKVFSIPISIKTITSSGLSSVKIIWTVDAESALKFRENYYPSCDLLLARINWNNVGNLFYIPLAVQRDVFSKIGKDRYIKLPKAGTNPRGVEFSLESLKEMISNKQTINLEIFWKKQETVYDTYKRWTDMWAEE